MMRTEGPIQKKIIFNLIYLWGTVFFWGGGLGFGFCVDGGGGQKNKQKS